MYPKNNEVPLTQLDALEKCDIVEAKIEVISNRITPFLKPIGNSECNGIKSISQNSFLVERLCTIIDRLDDMIGRIQ